MQNSQDSFSLESQGDKCQFLDTSEKVRECFSENLKLKEVRVYF